MRSIFHVLTEQVMFWYEFVLGAKETLYFVQYVEMDEYAMSFKPAPLLSVRSMAPNAVCGG